MDENVDRPPKLRCSQCGGWKDETEFPRSPSKVKRGGYGQYCKPCHCERTKRYQKKLQAGGRCKSCGQENPTEYGNCLSCRERANASRRKHNQELKLEVFKAYGGAECACCGEERLEFLSIDHIDNSGANHRKRIGKGGLYSSLRKSNYPGGYRVLCMNCNFALGRFGYCPHEWDKLYPMIYAEQDIDLTQWKEAIAL